MQQRLLGHRVTLAANAPYFARPFPCEENGRWYFLLTVRLSRPSMHRDGDGTGDIFGGVVACAFDASLHGVFHEDLDLGHTGRFLILREDGQRCSNGPFRKRRCHRITGTACYSAGIFLLKENHVIDCNPNAVTLFGYDRDRLLARPPWAFSPDLQPDGQSSVAKAEGLLEEARAGGGHGS